MDVDGILAEQVDYYRERAQEYDDWWERRNQYDDGPEFARAWRADIEQLRSWLDRAGPLGDVLELAAGTGNWTVELAARAASVTAVDASPETLALNAEKAEKAGAENVTYVVADLFAWPPPRRFGTVFFAFWLSHVPRARWEQFWDFVDGALAPGGHVLFCDNARLEHTLAHGPVRPSSPTSAARDHMASDELVTRTLRDGTTYQIVKRHWSPAELEQELAELGWRAAVAETTFAFVHGRAQRRGGS